MKAGSATCDNSSRLALTKSVTAFDHRHEGRQDGGGDRVLGVRHRLAQRVHRLAGFEGLAGRFDEIPSSSIFGARLGEARAALAEQREELLPVVAEQRDADLRRQRIARVLLQASRRS